MSAHISAEAWPGIRRRVHEAMAQQIMPFLASISRTNDDVIGEAHGSGVYLALSAGPDLVTCEHVVRQGYEHGYRISHRFRDGDYYAAFNNQWRGQPYPVDLAATLIDPSIWSQGDRLALPLDRIGASHDIAPNELLMICGYPGAASHFTRFTEVPELQSRLVPYTARETDLPPEYDPAYHFALEYQMDLAEPVDGGRGRLPAPAGFSGSPVWDTRFVASGCADAWRPEQSRVVGIAFEIGKTKPCLAVTRGEILTQFLKELENAEGS